MKSYRPTQSVLADVQRVLSGNRPSFHSSPLQEVAGLLCEGRHYSWAGVYLTFDLKSSPELLQNASEHHPGRMAAAGARKKMLVSMKLAGRELGFLSVESNRENAFGSEDRVLLDRVAGLLARFLAGPGKYLVLKAARPVAVSRTAAA